MTLLGHRDELHRMVTAQTTLPPSGPPLLSPAQRCKLVILPSSRHLRCRRAPHPRALSRILQSWIDAISDTKLTRMLRSRCCIFIAQLVRSASALSRVHIIAAPTASFSVSHATCWWNVAAVECALETSLLTHSLLRYAADQCTTSRIASHSRTFSIGELRRVLQR